MQHFKMDPRSHWIVGYFCVCYLAAVTKGRIRFSYLFNPFQTGTIVICLCFNNHYQYIDKYLFKLYYMLSDVYSRFQYSTTP